VRHWINIHAPYAQLVLEIDAMTQTGRHPRVAHIEHGTRSGYKKELSLGLDTCPECRAAANRVRQSYAA
jgi:hypothetical protein